MNYRWHRALWVSIAAGWMLIAISFTFNYYYSRHYVEIFSTPPTFLQMLVWEIPYWILWAAMAPLVFRITARFPLQRESWMRNAFIQYSEFDFCPPVDRCRFRKPHDSKAGRVSSFHARKFRRE